ncbi:MAG: MASE3 domain-containing protein [Rubrivivax sp.]
MREAAWWLAALVALLLVAWWVPVPQPLQGIAGYPPLHTLLETVAVVVAALIFAVGWNAYSRELPLNIVGLACAFLGVALLDFSHALSYAGMPDYVTPSDPEKAIGFWLAARALAGLALLAAAAAPWRPARGRGTRYGMLGAVLALTALVHWVLLFHQDWLPRTFVPGQGLTGFKVGFELALIALYGAAAVVLWLRMRRPQPFNAAALFVSVCTMALGEVFFTRYTNVNDVYNLTGHLYKVVAYGFLYRAVFVETVERPYAQLHAAQARLHTLVQTIPDPLWLKDTEGLLVDCNPAFERLLGRPRQELLGRREEGLAPAAQLAAALAQEAAALAAGGPVTVERPMQTATGSGLFEIIKTPLRGERGRLLGVLSLARDVTAARRNEEALRTSEQRLRQAVRAAHIGIFDHDHLTDSIHWSPEQRGHYGFDADEPVTLADFLARVHPEDRMRIATAVARAHDPAGDGLFDVEHRVVWRDGTERHLQTRSLTLFEGVGAARHKVRTFGAVIDVTEHRRVQAELQRVNATLEARVQERTRELARRNEDLVRAERLAALGRLVAGVAHELNTPLGNAVLVAGTLAARAREFERAPAAADAPAFARVAREISDVLERNLGRAAGLIGSFKQIAVDQSSHQRRRFELSEVVQEIALALSPSLRRSGVELVDRTPSGLWLDSYPGPLGQVLINLVNNAMLHAFEGRAGGRITIGAEAAEGGQVRLTVADDGTGIAPEHQPQIFDPFFTTRLGQGGSGLGLHIVYTLVTGPLGGRIELDSRPGEGTAFVCTLPASAPAGPEAVPLGEARPQGDGVSLR